MNNIAGIPEPRVLVIIVTWNKKQYVLDLLESLADIYQPYYGIDILVVDNASSDGTREAINTKHPEVSLIYNQENLGGTGGFNTGLQWAFVQPHGLYKYYWLLDNDVLVHRKALIELLALLDNNLDIAVAGSTMMQLDYPWRINEMGASIDRNSGQLVLNRHLEEIPAWRERSVKELINTELESSPFQSYCQQFMDVEYVAAASLLIRSEIAQKAGLWRDYFIHYDDVEWCLRIADLGYRIVVTVKSLIWHLSAAAKVPTWVLYYDNRNVLDMLKTHGYDTSVLRCYILKKAVYYYLIGKSDLAQLHYEAVADFQAGYLGKKDVRLRISNYQPNDGVISILLDRSIEKILIPWTVDLQATQLWRHLSQARLERPELHLKFFERPGEIPGLELPGFHITSIKKYISYCKSYWKLRGRYDLVIQSDYQPLICLSLLRTDLLYINRESFCRYPPLNLIKIFSSGFRWLFELFLQKSGLANLR